MGGMLVLLQLCHTIIESIMIILLAILMLIMMAMLYVCSTQRVPYGSLVMEWPLLLMFVSL